MGDLSLDFSQVPYQVPQGIKGRVGFSFSLLLCIKTFVSKE